MARCLIAGCGYVGEALGVRLAAEGHTVFGLRRRAVRRLPGVELLEADLGVPASLADLPDALDFIFYLASPGGAEDALYRSAYVDGQRHLYEALSHRQVTLDLGANDPIVRAIAAYGDACKAEGSSVRA